MKFIILVLLFPVTAFAHPGIGIVMDSKGNIFYTDLVHVWKIKPGGEKTIAVKNVHTHELYMDANDNLFGQQSWYNGEAKNTWGHYVWKLDAGGKLDTIINPTESFYIEEFSFVQDKAGNIYWIRHWRDEALMKTTKEGKTSELAKGNLKDIQWMLATADGLFYIQYDDIYVVDSTGIVKLFAKNVSDKKDGGKPLYGLWADKENNLYVPDMDLRKIYKVDKNGKVADYYTSKDNWLITGGVFDKEDNLWVLEYSADNEARVRKITGNNLMIKEKKEISFTSILVAGLVLLLGFVLYKLLKTFSLYYKCALQK